MANNIEVARAVVTIVPTMEGAQQTITSELTQAASSPGVSNAGRAAGSNFMGGVGRGLAYAGAATAAVGAAAIKAGDAFADAAGEVAEYGDNIDKMSQRLGLSYEGFQRWDYILGQSGVDIDSMQTGLKTLTNQLDDARNGSADAQARFEALGLSLEDINNMSREQVFESVISGFQRMEDSTERAALANDLFGRSGQNLTPLFNTSVEETKALADAAEELGLIMSDDAVKASADYQDALDTMQRSMAGLKNNMMGNFLPGITSVMDGLTELFTGDGDSGVAKITAGIDTIVEQMTANFPKILEVGMSIVQSLAQAIMDNLPALADAALQLVGTIASFILENLPTLIEVGLNMLITLADGIIENLPVIIPAVVDVVLTIVEKLTDPDTIVKLIEAALQIIIALAEGIIKALPKLIEKAPVIITNLLEALIRAIPVLLEAAGSIIATLGDGIINGLTTVAQWGADIIQTIKDAIMEKIEEAKTWGKDLIQNFVDGIKGALNLVGDAVKAVAQKIKDFIGFSEPKEGPLSDFHLFAPDMCDLFVEGLEDSKMEVQSELANVFNVSQNGMQMQAVDAGGGAPITIPVYIGEEKLDTIIVNAQSRYNLMSGGR
jgi:molecular chaperone GrpE (heat shock protein)